jgi:tetratricopeptide (TPR) repeat protein
MSFGPVAACVLALAAPPKAGGPRADYLELLRAYARGERAEAIAELGTWSLRELDRQLGQMARLVQAAELCRCPTPIEGVSLRAAVMLHADRDRAERPASTEAEQPRPCPGPQARLATRYAALLARLPEHRDFARRFFLATALRAQWDYCLEEAVRFGQDGIQLFPRDGELLLAVGSVYEEGATLGNTASLTRISGLPEGKHDNDRVSAKQRRKWMLEARRFLTDAVAADPENVLARLRLGRVLYKLGEADLAKQALAGAAEGSRQEALSFLSHLFLGKIQEDARLFDDAVAEYRVALGIDPTSQSAAVALAHALELTGEREAAVGVLGDALRAAGRRDGRDAFWDYLVGDAMRLESLLDELHRESLQ